jgi:glutamine synthetase
VDRQQEFVLRTLEERDIRFVRLWFTDVLGTLKSVSVAPAELEAAFDEGIGFDGSAIEGFARVYESDMVAMPDPTTFQVFPFEGGGSGESARMFCDILLPDGSRVVGRPAPRPAPRAVAAAEKGFTFYTHPEIEFFLLENVPADGASPSRSTRRLFDHTTHAVARDFRRQAVLSLERIGISVEFSHHEVAPVSRRSTCATPTRCHSRQHHDLPARDQGGGALARRARQLHAQAVHDQPGSGMHTHLSLFEGERNAFHDPSDPMKLSKVGKAFIAGLLTHAREYTAITNQWVNSYKRLFPQALPDRITESPAYVCWGHLNRSALVRVPAYGKPNSARAEIRSPDSACNPYLTFAVLLGAGLKGIEEGYELPAGAEDDVWSLSDAERRAMGYQTLPENLSEAIDVLAKSEFVAEVLGEHVFDFFIRNKRTEWEEYRREVTAFERRRYLRSL